MPPKNTANKPELSFEEAFEKLEATVDALEQKKLSLEDMMAHYELGAQLLKSCQEQLARAEDRIRLITLEPATQQEDASEESQSDPEATTTNDDVRLF